MHILLSQVRGKRFMPVITGWLSAIFILFFPLGSALTVENLSHVEGIVHVHSNFSTGRFSIQLLAKMARDRGIKIVFFTDHILLKISYGLPPFPALFKVTRSLPSVIMSGPEKYLKSIEEARLLFPDMVLIPGVESAPHYHWRGDLFKRDLKVVNWRKHLLLLGSEEPDFYSGIPVMHNVKKEFSWRGRGSLREIYVFFVPLAIGLVMLRWGKRYRLLGIIIAIISCLAVINSYLAHDDIHSPKSGDGGVEPYQKVFDYANDRGALIYWAHPESNLTASTINTALGPIAFETPPYPQDLLLTQNYTGFEAMYRDVRRLTDPGKEWDQALIQHITGKRATPVWGIAGADFHGDPGEDIGEVITVFMIKELNKEAVLEAMRKGRVYSLWRTDEYRLILEDFKIKDPVAEAYAVSYEGIRQQGRVRLKVQL